MKNRVSINYQVVVGDVVIDGCRYLWVIMWLGLTDLRHHMCTGTGWSEYCDEDEEHDGELTNEEQMWKAIAQHLG